MPTTKIWLSQPHKQHSSAHVFTMVVKYYILSLLSLFVSNEQQLNHPDIRKPVIAQAEYILLAITSDRGRA